MHRKEGVPGVVDKLVIMLVHVGDRCMLIGDRYDLNKESMIRCRAIEKCGLAVLTGSNNKKSKTELLLILSSGTISK